MVLIDLASVVSVWAIVGWWMGQTAAAATVIAGSAAAAGLVWCWSRGLYLRRPAPARVEEVGHLLVGVVIAACAAAAAAVANDLASGRARRDVALVCVLGAGVTWLLAAIGRGTRRELRAGRDAEPVIVVGDDAPRQFQLLLDHPDCGFAPLGVVTDPARSLDAGLGAHHLGRPDELLDLMAHLGADCAVVASAAEATVDRVRRAGHRVVVATDASRLGGDQVRVRSVGHQSLLVIERPPGERMMARSVKHLAERAVAAVALVAIAPFLALVGLVVRSDSPGPALYRSTRIGKGGRGFEMLKFRSMTVDAEQQRQQLLDQNERNGPLFKMTVDPRVTRVGALLRRTSIDELPQLVNVVRGEMSLVGPRPALPEEASAFDVELRERFAVLPGVTGLWQVEARNSPSFEAYRRLDLHYVENWSLRLDLQIVLATVVQVAVSLALVPARRLVTADGVSDAPVAVIDLRSPSTESEPTESVVGAELETTVVSAALRA
ncbi:MAG: exopolysaccharide biosynthesis polyprenyl glycosylphosphotransferase [Acidimicrobiales bacterium]